MIPSLSELIEDRFFLQIPGFEISIFSTLRPRLYFLLLALPLLLIDPKYFPSQIARIVSPSAQNLFVRGRTCLSLWIRRNIFVWAIIRFLDFLLCYQRPLYANVCYYAAHIHIRWWTEWVLDWRLWKLLRILGEDLCTAFPDSFHDEGFAEHGTDRYL